jgi:hypothetical protein
LSLLQPTRQVVIGGHDLTQYVTEFYCTDVDLIHGLGNFQVKLKDVLSGNTAAIAGLFTAYPESGLWDLAQFYINGKLIFSGKVESVQFDFSKGDFVTIDGYNMAAELQNIEIDADYSNPAGQTPLGQNYLGLPADALLYDIFEYGGIWGKTFNLVTYPSPAFHAPAFPSAASTPGKWTDTSMYDLIKEVEGFLGYSARVTETLTAGKATLQFHSISPLASVDPAPIISGVILRSLYPSQLDNVKSGTVKRDLHNAKNWIKLDGAGSGGFDPMLDGLTGPASAPAWTSQNAATITNDPTDLPPFAASGELVDSAETVLAQIIAPTVWRAESLYFQFNGAAPYQIVDPYGYTNLNLIFNQKENLHFWIKVKTTKYGNTMLYVQSQDPSQPFYNYPGLAFTDGLGVTAHWLNSTTNLPLALTNYSGSNAPWKKFTIPLPTLADKSGLGNGYEFSDVPRGSPSDFALDWIVKMQIYASPEYASADSITYMAIDDCYFTCTPFYLAQDVAGAGATWGERDTRTSVKYFTQQLDLQNYGKGLLANMKNPMLRMNPLTYLVDPAGANSFIVSGSVLQVNIPRWSFPTGTPQYWRVLQVRRDWSKSKGYIETVDIIPATAT